MAANAVWRSGPHGMEHRVEQQSALRRCEAGLCWLPALRAEPRCGEGFEGTLRLRSENGSAACDLARREGNAAEVLERIGKRIFAGLRDQIRRKSFRRPGNLDNQPRWTCLCCLVLLCAAEVNLAR